MPLSLLFFQKLELRKSALFKTNALTEAQRETWKKVVTKDFMSSEESGEENVGDGARQVIFIKVLPWRAPKVNRFFKTLDHKASKNKSRQSRQQTLPRVVGRYSNRSKPIGFADDFFGFTAN